MLVFSYVIDFSYVKYPLYRAYFTYVIFYLCIILPMLGFTYVLSSLCYILPVENILYIEDILSPPPPPPPGGGGGGGGEGWGEHTNTLLCFFLCI
jgi:hypothetical protein